MIPYSDFSLRRALLRGDKTTFLLAMTLLLTFLVTCRTVCPPRLPLGGEYGEATAYRLGDYTVVEYERDFEVYADFMGRVSRVVECDGARTFDIPSISRPFKKGSYHTSRTFSIPFRYPVGSDCRMRTFVEWQPLFSMGDHVQEISPVKFKVIGKD